MAWLTIICHARQVIALLDLPRTALRDRTPGGALWSSFAVGPVGHTDDPVVISFTEFRPHHLRDLPDIVKTGLSLKSGWYAMEGAVGMWLWSQPLRGRSGSLSIWRDERSLRRFVALPRHLAVMRRYRDRGRLRSSTWQAQRFVPVTAKLEAHRLLALPADASFGRLDATGRH